MVNKLLLILFATCLFQFAKAQTNVPVFNFPEFKYFDSAFVSKIATKINMYEMNLNINDKKQILSKCLKSQIPARDYLCISKFFNIIPTTKIKDELRKQAMIEYQSDSSYTSYIFEAIKSNSIEIDTFQFYTFHFLDFNKDAVCDMILMPGVYFGPSLGFHIIGSNNGKYQLYADISGNFSTIDTINNKIYIQYHALVIDPLEAQIIYTFQFNLQTKNCILDSKIYLGTQTKIPKPQNPVIPIICNDSVFIRYAPIINNDTTGRSNIYKFDTVSRVIYGNIVAKFDINAEGYQIAEENDWIFVAINSEKQMKCSSLHHGMDFYNYDKPFFYDDVKIKPYVCGWIEKKKIRKKKL